MRLKPLLAAFALGFGLFASTSHASTVIDFSLTPAGNLASYTESGVTFTAVSGSSVTATTFGNSPNGTPGLVGGTNPFLPIKAVISGGASFVSIDLGDYGADGDLLFLEVYDASDVLLGISTLLIPNTDTTMHTLSLAKAGIAYAIYGSRSPSVSGSSVYTDNFTFDSAAAAVPEPSTIAGGLLAGVFGLIAARRRKV